jgi:hypothetical protein
MRSDKAHHAFVLATALLSISTRTAMAWDDRKECVDFYKAEAGSKNLVCDKKKGNARQDCFDGVTNWVTDRIAGCPDK